MKVSVIIPVFNAEEHLAECVNSVLSQKDCDFELLLINDGSTDSSGAMCDEFGRNDQRINVFHQVNLGVSAARNKGVENAQGEWLTFVDADDYIQENYFKILSGDDKTDWIHLDMQREACCSNAVKINFENQEYSVAEFVNFYSLYPHFPEACAKFFKNSLIKLNALKFDTALKFGEDSVFNLKYLKSCDTVTTANFSKYVYKNVEGGLSKLTYDIKNDTTLFNEIEKELKLYSYPTKFCEETIRIPLTRYMKILYYDNSISPEERRRLLRKNIEKYYKVVLTIYTNPKIRLFIIFAYYTNFYSVLDFVFSRIKKRHE